MSQYPPFSSVDSVVLCNGLAMTSRCIACSLGIYSLPGVKARPLHRTLFCCTGLATAAPPTLRQVSGANTGVPRPVQCSKNVGMQKIDGKRSPDICGGSYFLLA